MNVLKLCCSLLQLIIKSAVNIVPFPLSGYPETTDQNATLYHPESYALPSNGASPTTELASRTPQPRSHHIPTLQ